MELPASLSLLREAGAARRLVREEFADLLGLGATQGLQDRQRAPPSGLRCLEVPLLLCGHADLPQSYALAVAVADAAQDRETRLVLCPRLGMPTLVTPHVAQPQAGAALPRLVADLQADRQSLIQTLLRLGEPAQRRQRNADPVKRLALAMAVPTARLIVNACS